MLAHAHLALDTDVCLHSLVCDNAICAAGLKIADDIPLSVNFHAAQNILWPRTQTQFSRPLTIFLSFNLPSYPPKVRRVPRIAQVDPAAHTCSASASFGTGTPGPGSSAPLIPRLYETKASRRGKCLRLALQAGIICGMFGEHVVEKREEARIPLERVWCRWNRGCSANCKGWIRRSGVEIG